MSHLRWLNDTETAWQSISIVSIVSIVSICLSVYLSIYLSIYLISVTQDQTRTGGESFTWMNLLWLCNQHYFRSSPATHWKSPAWCDRHHAWNRPPGVSCVTLIYECEDLAVTVVVCSPCTAPWLQFSLSHKRPVLLEAGQLLVLFFLSILLKLKKLPHHAPCVPPGG